MTPLKVAGNVGTTQQPNTNKGDTQMAISNRDASGPISRREAFRTHNQTLSASDLIGQYIVYSYAEPIAVFDKASKTWYATERDYSVTTSRHQGIINYGMSKSGHEVKWTQMRLVQKGWL